MKKLLIITQKVDMHDQLLGFFVPWLKKFAEHFSQITVLCLEKGAYELPSNVQVISLGKDQGKQKWMWLWNMYRFSWTQRHNYNAVFVHMNPIWGATTGWFWHILGKGVYLWYTHKAVTLKLRIAEFFADSIFTASKESFRLPSKKVIVTGHGIDTDVFTPDPHRIREPFSLLTVGRIAPVKNYDVLIDAVKLLHDPRIKVTVVGQAALEEDRAYERKIRERMQNEGLSSQFVFVGKMDNRDLVPLYQSHALFVHMSKTGSVDKVLLEAMACGMQVVSSNDSALAFLPSESIFRGDDSRDLADKIKSAIQKPVSPEMRDYVVDHHNLENLIGKISQIIQKE